MSSHLFKLGNDISKVGLELDISIQMLLKNKNLLWRFINHFLWQGASELIKKEKELSDLENAKNERIKGIREYEKSPPLPVQLHRAALAVSGQKDLSKQKTEDLILSIENDYNDKRSSFNLQKEEFYALGKWMSEQPDEFIDFMHQGLKRMQKSSKSFEIDVLRLIFIESLYANENKDLLAFNQLQSILIKQSYIFISDISAFSNFEKLSLLNIKSFYQKIDEFIPIETLATPIIINQDNPYFSFFFALSIRQCKIEYLGDFLEFQSKKYNTDFNIFLRIIIFDYQDIIKPTHIIFIEDFITKNLSKSQENSFDNIKKNVEDKPLSTNENKPEFSIKQKLKFVLPLVFLRYESEIELGEKRRFPKTWDDWKKLFFTKTDVSQPPPPLKPKN